MNSQGGIPDIAGTARSVLRDWVSGRIPYYTSPPAAPAPGSAAAAPIVSDIGTVSAHDVDSAALLTTFAPAFDLAALFGEADAVAFGSVTSTVSNSVRMVGIEGESEDANVGWVTGDNDDDEDISEAEVEMEEDDEVINVDDLLEDDDEDAMDEDVVPAPVVVKAVKKGKKGASTNVVSVEPSSKKSRSVSFAARPLGPTGGGGVASTSAVQKAKLFTPNDEEAPGSSLSLSLSSSWGKVLMIVGRQSHSTKISRRMRRRIRRRQRKRMRK